MQKTKMKTLFSFLTTAVSLTITASYGQEQPNYPFPAEITSRTDGATLKLLRGGRFKLGMSKEETKIVLQKINGKWEWPFDTELAERYVELPDLYIDKFEVTNHQYNNFVKRGGGTPSIYKSFPQFNGPNQPVTGISWESANLYCKWAGRRLPTEDEWERAARGKKSLYFPWGYTPDSTRFNGRTTSRYAPANVGSFPLGDTEEGVSDLAGNVWEWTSDFWQRDNRGRAMRGGSFLNSLAFVRTTLRWASSDQDIGAEYVGFRCIIEAQYIQTQ